MPSLTSVLSTLRIRRAPAAHAAAASTERRRTTLVEIAFFVATLVAIAVAAWYYGFVIPAQEEQARFAEFDRHEAIFLQREEAAQLQANIAMRLPKTRAGFHAGTLGR